ncbi:MAG: adenylyltransferase/cytidyltransferase family protein, partial [Deltaproteobacteria bacterium]|nr:adenylyltransferase/cytidyltransferase family protein [Deltaproteobacteria bacterium]
MGGNFFQKGSSHEKFKHGRPAISSAREKILWLRDLSAKVRELQAQGKTVVQSHGVFDIIHPGIIHHLEEAREMGDVLVVTVIRDANVRRGPGRPVFPEDHRAKNVASLSIVDYVAVVDDEMPFDCVKQIRPDILARGQAHAKRDRKIHNHLFHKERELFLAKSRLLETKGFEYITSDLINEFLDVLPGDARRFLDKFSGRYRLEDVVSSLDRARDLSVLLIGDGIVDEYHYCSPLGKSAKAQLVVNKYLNHEVFAGGAFAIANHVSGIAEKVTLATLLGEEDPREEFARSHLAPNVKPRFFFRDDGPTVVKKRYVDHYTNQKLFEVNFLNDAPVSGPVERDILDFLADQIPKHDLVLVSDFGHGLLSPAMVELIESTAGRLAVNSQTNAANSGFNLITRYKGAHFVCLDEAEARLSVGDKFGPVEDVACRLADILETELLLVTTGKKGSVGVARDREIFHTPIFSSKVV